MLRGYLKPFQPELVRREQVVAAIAALSEAEVVIAADPGYSLNGGCRRDGKDKRRHIAFPTTG
jgi:hypothetical protein